MADNENQGDGERATGSPGFELRPAHYPGRAPIDAYGNGGFRFADMSHRGSVLMLPSGIYAWNLASSADLSMESLSRVLDEADNVEILLVGTGLELRPLPEAWRATFREAAISADSMSTGAAVRTYNVLLAEGRAVAAALVAVD